FRRLSSPARRALLRALSGRAPHQGGRHGGGVRGRRRPHRQPARAQGHAPEHAGGPRPARPLRARGQGHRQHRQRPPGARLRRQSTIGPRTDLFALGQIAYTLLTGEPYWTEELKGADSVFPLLTKIVTGPPEPPSARARRRRGIALPPAFDAWLGKAVASRQE